MKKRLSISLLLALVVSSVAMADIQSSQSTKWNWSRKLTRAIANIAYGPSEVLSYMTRSNRNDGNLAASIEGPIEGGKRGIIRIGYGIWELATFPVHAYKGTYRPPFYKKANIDPWFGYDEFPPQFGIQTQSTYSRHQSW